MNTGLLRFRRRFSSRLRAFGLMAAVASVSSCNDLDTTRQAPPIATLGDDIFGVFCDRVGASVLTEDLSGVSYQSLCHYDETGAYGSEVDTTLLPPPANEKSKEARRLAIAKLEAMARRRTDLIQALNAAFPDIEITDANTPGGKIRLHDALLSFSQSLTPLYESNPFDAQGEAVLPSSTRAIARLMGAFAESESVRKVLSSIWGRRGYRPSEVGLGVVRPLLSYPGLRNFGQAGLNVLAPNGRPSPELDQLLAVAKEELKTASPTISKLPKYELDAATIQPNRPRETLEFASAAFLSQNDAFANLNGDQLFIAQRDRRGFVTTTTTSTPFADVNGDGLADVDPFGRFADGSGSPLTLDPPFVFPGIMTSAPDSFGRPADAVPLYGYIDAERTALAGLVRQLPPLFDATVSGSGADAWKSEHETLMYALAGAYLLYGDREPAQYDFANEAIKTGTESCPGCLQYMRFKGEDSPLPDLLHATGQILADPESDALLESLLDLVENHEQVVARALGAALRIREITLQHDELAAQGKEPLAELAYDVPIWDEMAELLGRIVKKPGLVEDVLKAMADPEIVTPYDGANHIGDAFANTFVTIDELSYNPEAINGFPRNITDGGASTEPAHNPVDRSKPTSGKNRSLFQRVLKIIHDANGGPACNKQGAKVKVDIVNLTLTWPLVGAGYNKCDLFKFDNLAAFYLDSVLPLNHPKRSKLVINDGVLNALMQAIGGIVSPDKLFSDSSGIDGLTQYPDPDGLNRLVFFGADSNLYPGMPDLDPYRSSGQKNAKTNTFISNLIEPVSSSYCPPDPADSNKSLQCPTKDGTLRVADPNTLFALERNGFYNYLRPLVVAFAGAPCDTMTEGPQCGEKLFLEVIETLNRHWPGKEHGSECAKSDSAKQSNQYCSEAGANRYEPLLADAFRTDIIPALHEFSKVAKDLSKITVKRGPKAGQVWTGAVVMEKLVKILFDQDYAKSVGMMDRKGNKSTKWVDGTPQSQVTGFSLFADALHGIDLRWQTACSSLTGGERSACEADVELRKGQWKRARSQLVDVFLAVEGTGDTAKFKHPGLPKVLASVLRVLREQLNAHCPDRETGVECTWAKKDLGQKFATTLSGPMFAALMDLQEQIRKDEPARRETERLLAAILSSDSLPSVLVSGGDALQVLLDDERIAPILNIAASAANPSSDPEGAGALATGLSVLKAVTSDEFDPHHALDAILPNLVTPMASGVTPLEVIMDTIAEVNRFDASMTPNDPLDTEDYKYIMGTVRDFMTSETRGLEQFYTIIQKRPRP